MKIFSRTEVNKIIKNIKENIPENGILQEIQMKQNNKNDVIFKNIEDFEKYTTFLKTTSYKIEIFIFGSYTSFFTFENGASQTGLHQFHTKIYEY